MKLLQVILLELRSLVRSKTLAVLSVVAIAWMFALPYLLKSDGTSAGAHEIYVHYSLGGVFLLLVIALVSSAAGSLAVERTAKRLQLTLVRPVPYWLIAWGRILAQLAVGAFVLALAMAVLFARVDHARPCAHVLSPVLPTPQEEAKAMCEKYLNDPETPDEVRRAKRSVVLRMLAQRALDNYQVLTTNSTAAWTFRTPESTATVAGVLVRLRFTNQYEMRQEVRGTFEFDGVTTAVSNFTQSVLMIPLRTGAGGIAESKELKFHNAGGNPLMLRPRRDINLLLPADGFLVNAFRAYLILVANLAILLAFATLLSSGLGRPVAVFTVLVTLIVGAISPSVVGQYPDELESNRIDRIGLAITRTAAAVTHPVAALSPLSALSQDECVEWNEVVQSLIFNLIAAPLALSLLAALILPRKQEET